MAINTQFPSWITEGRIAEAQLGQQMGRNILEGLRFQEQKKQIAEEQRRYDELAPMRTAQMELMRAKTTQEILQNEQQVRLQNIFNERQAATTEAMALQSGIERSQGKWTSSDNKAAFYSFLKNNPALVGGEWDKSMRDQFDKAEKADFELKKIEKLNEGRLNVARERAFGQYSAANLKQAGWEDLANQIGEGVTPMEALDKVNESAQGPGSWLVKRAATSIKSRVAALNEVGVGVEPYELLESFSKELAPASGRGDDKTFTSDIKSEDLSYKLLDQASNQIDEFNQKYAKYAPAGQTAFDAFVGPFDRRRMKFERMMLPPNEVSQLSNEAAKIMSKVNDIIVSYRKNKFGTALTQTETQSFKDSISTPEFADYTNSLRNFRDNLKERLALTTYRYKLSPQMPVDIIKTWSTTWEPARVGAPTGQTGGRQVQGGVIGQPQPVGQPVVQPAGQPTQGVRIFDLFPDGTIK